jgi:hypothetical protein
VSVQAFTRESPTPTARGMATVGTLEVWEPTQRTQITMTATAI